jgi:hypothetical protein
MGAGERLAEAERRELGGDVDLVCSAIRLHAKRTLDEKGVWREASPRVLLRVEQPSGACA